jgi:L-arabinose 1-dehydrogenase [NAD(P)+]
MTRIALTGAAGNVGRAVLDALGDDHDLVAFTHSETDDIDSRLLDVTDAEEVRGELDAFDVVVHLAGASSPDAGWDAVSETNVQGTKHVLDAAVENGIDRVVFASSNHAVGNYNAVDDDPEKMTLERARTVEADAPPSPDSFYGVSKAACEGLTKFYAETRGLEVVNLRIGWLLDEAGLRETVAEAADPGRERFARAAWLSPRDCRDVHQRAVLADLPDGENPVTVNAVSRNDERFHAITETMRLLGYRPRSNAAEVLDE